MADDIFNTAVDLLSLKRCVIPSGGGDTKKHPIIAWTEFQNRLPTLEELKKWQRNNNPSLWGIVTGIISGILVFDADDATSIELFDQAGLKPHVKTKRGQHYYFKHPGHEIKNKVGVLPHLDLRGDGGFVNCIGSNELASYEILILPDDSSLYDLAQLPLEVKEVLLSQDGKEKVTNTAIGDVIKNGTRNETLSSLAGSMRHRGLSQAVIKTALHETNQKLCVPPLADSEVLKIAKSISRYEPKTELLPSAESPQDKETVSLVCMSDVEVEAVSWLWLPYIPKGKLTLMEGDPGIGKSWVSLAIATAVTLGKGLLGQEPTEPANVVIASAEDGLGDTIRPRLDAMGANVKNVHAIKGALDFGNGGLPILEGYIEQVNPALVIIDPLVAYIGATVDIHRANETRAVMSQLADMAEKHGCGILAVRHLTKGSMSKAIYRGIGSIDFAAACRSVLMAGCDPDNEQKRGIVQIKSNLAPKGKAIGYELKDGGFFWTGESDLTAAKILAADNGAGTSELDEAMTFLKDKLADGEMPAKDIYQAAQDTGIAKRTLERAKAKLQAQSRKRGDTWFWCLPESTSPTSYIQNLGELENIEAKKEDMTEGIGDVDIEAVLGICVKGGGGCQLRTDAGKAFDCVFTPEHCQFQRDKI